MRLQGNLFKGKHSILKSRNDLQNNIIVIIPFVLFCELASSSESSLLSELDSSSIWIFFWISDFLVSFSFCDLSFPSVFKLSSSLLLSEFSSFWVLDVSLSFSFLDVSVSLSFSFLDVRLSFSFLNDWLSFSFLDVSVSLSFSFLYLRLSFSFLDDWLSFPFLAELESEVLTTSDFLPLTLLDVDDVWENRRFRDVTAWTSSDRDLTEIKSPFWSQN